MAVSAKREDLTPKTKRLTRGTNTGRGVNVARSRGVDTSNMSAAEIAEIISPDKPLTDKQKLFVKYWAQGESITSASVRAGYNDGAAIAYRMAKYPNVLALYHQIKAKYEEASQMTRQKVMDGLLEAVEMAKLMAEPMTMIAGWREVGKMCGYYAPVEHKIKVDVTGNIVVDRLNSMSDAELLKVITQGAQQALAPPGDA
jgi:phage terminase small subunit